MPVTIRWFDQRPQLGRIVLPSGQYAAVALNSGSVRGKHMVDTDHTQPVVSISTLDDYDVWVTSCPRVFPEDPLAAIVAWHRHLHDGPPINEVIIPVTRLGQEAGDGPPLRLDDRGIQQTLLIPNTDNLPRLGAAQHTLVLNDPYLLWVRRPRSGEIVAVFTVHREQWIMI